ncbi:MAG: TonB-dependent receptor [Gammaproteobacteria bacterium]|nr:TonB-dependent receptor [Gammaproteobacteria bacterium]
MRFNKNHGLAYVLSLAMPLTVALTQQAVAADDEMDAGIEEVITTGTRAEERSVTESPAPIDVISGDSFTNQGDTDLSNLIRNVVPSYNVNTQPISDAATIVRPANLRGLAPDHTLVLVNGKRRHRSAVISWLGNGVGDGAQGPDLSLIPSTAIKQVEVLRDGASSQYGSDAIAGVMNFILKDDSEGATLEARYGEYTEGDGTTYAIAGNIGLPFSDNGFVNLSFEYGEADATDRSVQRNDAAALIAAGNTAVANPAQIWGSPDVMDDFKSFVNIGLDLGEGREFYAHGNYATKTVDGGFYFRNPNTRGAVFSGDGGGTLLIGDLFAAGVTGDDGMGACPTVTIMNDVPDPTALAEVFARDQCWSFQELFPGGFTPRFGGDVSDVSAYAGVRGEMQNGLRFDVSLGAGRSEVDFFIRNTVNASLGPATPVSFDPGAYIQLENSVNLDFGYTPTDNTNLAFGGEYRRENFEIRVGDEASFTIGPLAPQGFSAASNGFPGFSNIAGGSFSRENIALYVDGEWEPTEQLLLGAAVRWEDFQDFGTTTNWKVAGNWRATDTFGLRATASTGFRAPTPGQSNAFNVSTEFDATINDLVNNGTVPATSRVVGKFLGLPGGGPALQPEESTNYTLGTFFNIGDLDVTIDYFQIEVDDRLNLSGLVSLSDQDVADLLAEGVTSAANLANFRWFTNDFDTETKGFDVVATYPLEWGNSINTDLAFSFNKTDTKVTRAGPSITNEPVRITELEDGLPETRWNLSANTFYNQWRFLTRLSMYDDWFDSEDGNTYDGKSIVDVEGAYSFNDNFTGIIGVQNLFDETPDENPGAAGGVGNRYSQFSPFGFNGAFWYLRLRYDLD